MIAKNDMPALRGKSFKELEALIQRAGFQGFRTKQLYHWLYQRDARSFDEMHNLPGALIAFLKENYRVGGVEILKTLAARDGSKKLLFGLRYGNRVEGVLMPRERRWTLCVSTQAGCALACGFCMTGRVGFIRDLDAGEILDQVQIVRRELLSGDSPTNVVLMGMGEPLLNAGPVIDALRILTCPGGAGIPNRRVTVSTAGIVPGVRALAQAGLKVNLAVSLNAADDETRNALMPINKKYPLKELIEACAAFPLEKKKRVTFEYVMLDGVNDSPEDMRKLAALLRPVRCKINLIQFNELNELPYRASPPERVDAFAKYLSEKDYVVAVRRSQGREIRAACGQLTAEYNEKEE